MMAGFFGIWTLRFLVSVDRELESSDLVSQFCRMGEEASSPREWGVNDTGI